MNFWPVILHRLDEMMMDVTAPRDGMPLNVNHNVVRLDRGPQILLWRRLHFLRLSAECCSRFI